MADRTVAQALLWATDQLAQARERADREETDEERAHTARAEAETLWAWTSGWNRQTWLLSLQTAVEATLDERFSDAVQRRTLAEPLQYITGEAPFYGRMFAVRPGCLIPRPETEWLVASAIEWIASQAGAVNAIDIGTGSGAIALTIALECPQANVRAVDISAAALAIAAENQARLGAAITLHHSDGIAWLAAGCDGTPPTLVVSNPPYIPEADIAGLDVDVRDHEPHVALTDGEDGRSFYRRLAALGPSVFAPGPAALLLEVGIHQAGPVLDLFHADAAWAQWTFDTVPDLRGIERIVRGRCD